ncbi:hypothetical protein KJ068_20215 [bacterium]|nr:MAG: hypothetical protein EDS67_26365 [candidate division KSB1 bacterium]MCE7943582.1 hypothetical protein [Chlorobi bacterium CHB1]MCL4707488.1 hypothetical protein [bacterium]MDL1878474.1 hypothetical protein [Cytophagia bacterium CHB2]MBC6947783.1 hypothetical protein [candidate division KSB1 bacterium]
MDDDRKKYIEQWWRKYEAANEFEAEYRLSEESLPPPQVMADFLDSVYRMWLKSGDLAAESEANLAHHIAVQKVFAKMRQLHDDGLRTNPARY